jgi:hypothetical protein
VPRQLRDCLRSPETHLNPTAYGIASKLGEPGRWAEVKPHLQAYLAKNDEEDEGLL